MVAEVYEHLASNSIRVRTETPFGFSLLCDENGEPVDLKPEIMRAYDDRNVVHRVLKSADRMSMQSWRRNV